MSITNKQDRSGVRTASDLERKYDLGALVGIKKAVQTSIESVNKINTILENFMRATLGTLDNLQSQIDGNITTWFERGNPTLLNFPTSEWVTDEDKTNHIGDLYYDKDTGYAYRFTFSNSAYEWSKITDNDVVEALAIANAASDTADSKRRVFTDTPVPPYDNGDLWFNNQEIYICQISKAKEEKYAQKDFIIATKYTDDTLAVQIKDELKILQGTVTTIKEGADQFKVTIEDKYATKAELALKVDINNLVSTLNASADVIKLLANRLIIESTYFKLTSDGKIEATGGNIGKFTISDKLTVSVEGYVSPGQEERDKVSAYITKAGTLTANELKYLDLNGTGTVTIHDLLLIQKIILGEQDYSKCSNAVKSTITAKIDPTDPNKLVYLTATTPWGTKKETWLGITECFAPATRAKVITGDVVQTTAGADLDEINSNLNINTYTLASSVVDSIMTVVTTGQIASIRVSGRLTKAIVGWSTVLFTLPTECRPKQSIYIYDGPNSSNLYYIDLYGRIVSSKSQVADSVINFVITYPLQ